jgi:hypothetical protein
MTEPQPDSRTSAYVDQTLELLGDQDPLLVLEETAAWMTSHTEHLPESVMRTPEAPEKWSLTEVFAHLADIEIVFGWRARLTLAASPAPITGFDERTWVKRFDYLSADPADALHCFATLRNWNMRVWRAATESDYTECIGVHSERGDESFERLIRMTAGHDLRHRRQVSRILAVVT